MNKLLLVEDDQFLVRIYKVKLKQLNFDVTFLNTGEKVHETALLEKPDLILLDIVMPVKDGFQAMKELKGDPQTKNIPVMILTNLNGDNDKKTLMDLGAAKFVVKSDHSFSEVASMIQEILHTSTSSL